MVERDDVLKTYATPNKGKLDPNSSSTSKSQKRAIFLAQSVKERKNYPLKNRLKTLINAGGMSEPDFFNKIQISRQLWYYYSWGIWETPIPMKVKIAQALDTDSSAIFLEDCDIKTTHQMRKEEEK